MTLGPVRVQVTLKDKRSSPQLVFMHLFSGERLDELCREGNPAPSAGTGAVLPLGGLEVAVVIVRPDVHRTYKLTDPRDPEGQCEGQRLSIELQLKLVLTGQQLNQRLEVAVKDGPQQGALRALVTHLDGALGQGRTHLASHQRQRVTQGVARLEVCDADGHGTSSLLVPASTQNTTITIHGTSSLLVPASTQNTRYRDTEELADTGRGHDRHRERT